MNKLTDSQKRWIVLGIGLLMVLLGVVQAVFKIDFFTKYRKLIDEGSFILMMIAAVLLFSIKRKPKQESETPENQAKPEKLEAEPESQTEEKK